MRKILIAVLSLFLLATLGLWFSGKDTRVVSTSIEISASPEDVWEIISNVEDWKNWSPIIKDSSGKTDKDSVVTITMISDEGKSGKPGPQYTPTITELENSKKLAWIASMGPGFVMTNGKSLELEKTENGTRLVHKETFSGLMVPLMWGKVQKNVPKMLDSMNLALKNLAEGYQNKPVLFVMTNQGTMKVDGSDKPTGLWLSEFTKPYYVLKDAGFKIVLATPNGGAPPIDPRSQKDRKGTEKEYNDRFLNDSDLQKDFAATRILKELTPSDYRAIIFPGGHGPMFDLAIDPTSQKFITSIYEAGGIVGALCHGPAALVNVKLTNGEYLVKGRKITAFTDSEENAVDLAKDMPFLLETTLRKRGANFLAAEQNFGEKVVKDGRLITGQNPASALSFGEGLKEMLNNESMPKKR